MRIGIIYTLYLRAHIISSLYTMQLNSCTIEWFKHLVIGIPKCIEFIIINNGHTDSYFIYLYIYIYIYIYIQRLSKVLLNHDCILRGVETMCVLCKH